MGRDKDWIKMATRDLSGERRDEFMKCKVNNNSRI